MTHYDIPYEVQDVLKKYLVDGLATYADAIAVSLPVIVSGEFEDRGRDHVFVHCKTCVEEPRGTAIFVCRVAVGVATGRETPLDAHRDYCKAVFDLCMDANLTTAATDNGTLSVFHSSPQRQITTEILPEYNMRTAMIELRLSAVCKPSI